MVKIYCGYYERVNEQVIDVITMEMGRMGSLLGMPWCCGLYLAGLRVKISALSRLRTELMIHLA